MSRTDEGLDQLAEERRLLQEVCALVRSEGGRPSVAALDVVLGGSRRPAVSCSRGPRRRPATPGRWRPGSGSGSVRRVDGSV